MGALLEVDSLTKNFGGLTAVNKVTFSVREGEILSVIGPNGAGKSTLFKLVSGFLRVSAGSVRYKGSDITGMSPHNIAQRGIVRTFQETTIFRQMTAFQNVVVAHHLSCRAGTAGIIMNTSQAREDERKFARQSLEILERLGIGNVAYETARDLPHGHLRALSIAVALACQPKLLLLDEPFTGLNPHETDFAGQIVDDVRKGGVTVVLVEHDMRAVMKLSDRIIVLNFGTKIAEGSPEEIQHDENVVEAYLGRDDDDD